MHNDTNAKSITIAELARGKTQRQVKLMYKSTDKHKFLNKDEVPEGQYFSFLIEIEESKTVNGDAAIDVYYTIVDAPQYVRYWRKLIEKKELEFYYIKERYPLNSQRYHDFLDMLYNEYGFNKEIDPKELKYMFELYDIEYDDYGRWGRIYNRNIWLHEYVKDYAELENSREEARRNGLM